MTKTELKDTTHQVSNTKHLAKDFMPRVDHNHAWVNDFMQVIKLNFPSITLDFFSAVSFGNRRLISLDNRIVIHPISLNDSCQAMQALRLQEFYALMDVVLIQLWEDIWLNQSELVMSRIKSHFRENQASISSSLAKLSTKIHHIEASGLNKHITKIHARQTIIYIAKAEEAQKFYSLNHQMTYSKQKYHYALRYEGEIVSMASFGDIRPMPSKGADYRSTELVRFANKMDYSIPGGLSKLIKAFLAHHPVHDIMTYADRDWTLGNAYYKVGFTLAAIQAPQSIYYHIESNTRYFLHRLPKYVQAQIAGITTNHASISIPNFEQAKALLNLGYIQLFNTGNLKFYYEV